MLLCRHMRRNFFADVDGGPGRKYFLESALLGVTIVPEFVCNKPIQL